MNMISKKLEGQPPLHAANLSPAQQDLAMALMDGLTRDQAIWLSGYFAGFAARPMEPQVTASPPAAAVTITVLYGSETGNARKVAAKVGAALEEKGFVARTIDMAAYKPNQLKNEKYLIIVTATHGEGEPPDAARSFHEFLMGRKAPRLEGTRFAVLGLGDTSYEHFCQTAKDFDARLEALGAERIQARIDCDVDYEETATAWLQETLQVLNKLVGNGPASSPASVRNVHPAAPQPQGNTPFPARVLERVVLNGRGSDKTTYHLELGFDSPGLSYRPGDSLSVITENDPALVDEIATALDLDGGDQTREELRRSYELTILTPKFVTAYAQETGTKDLINISADKAALRDYMKDRQIADVIREYPARGLPSSTFKSMLRKLQPRLYSLSSSLLACPDEAHITVAEVAYKSPFAQRYGVASGYLGRRLALDDEILVCIEHNDRFRLPDDPETPIIMIGAGTGVAPYRAFLQERAEQGATGKSWLFFGERRFRTDFLYQTEWQAFMKDGVLTRMDVAFSRDQNHKIYVQDRLKQQGQDVFAWLQEGAHLYVCGDAKNMAPDVHNALIGIVASHGGKSEDAARDYVNNLITENRYKRDIY